MDTARRNARPIIVDERPITALIGERTLIQMAERLRSDHVDTLIDMANTITGYDPISSSVAKLLHVAMRQQQAAWRVEHASASQTAELLVGLAERLATDGRMNSEMLAAVVREIHSLTHRVAGRPSDMQPGL